MGSIDWGQSHLIIFIESLSLRHSCKAHLSSSFAWLKFKFEAPSQDSGNQAQRLHSSSESTGESCERSSLLSIDTTFVSPARRQALRSGGGGYEFGNGPTPTDLREFFDHWFISIYTDRFLLEIHFSTPAVENQTMNLVLLICSRGPRGCTGCTVTACQVNLQQLCKSTNVHQCSCDCIGMFCRILWSITCSGQMPT